MLKRTRANLFDGLWKTSWLSSAQNKSNLSESWRNVVYVYPLYAVAAGFVSFMDNDLFHKLMQKLRGQLCRLGVLLYDFQKTLNIDGLHLSGLNNDAQTFNGLFQFCLLRFIGCGQFGKPFIC